jgi:hypothetical protein
MTQNKIRPWLDGSYGFESIRSSHFFELDSEEIDFCINVLEAIDMDGLRFNLEFIKSWGFFVGFFLENIENESTKHLIERVIAFFNEEVDVFWVPAKDEDYQIGKEIGLKSDYDPPLIAKSILSISNYNNIRSGMIQWRNGSFYCFSKNKDFIILFVDGYYSMIAGTRFFVEKAIGESYESSWKSVDTGDGIDHLHIPKLRDFLLNLRESN